MMQFKDIVMERYATRGFDGKKIPDDQVKALQELIRYAPSSYNVQPWRVVVISDNERKKTLLDAAWKQPQVTSCSHLFVFCANTELEACTDRLENELKGAGVPQNTITGFIGMIRGFLKSLSPDARLPWAQRQTYIALANGLNGAKSLGFDSCPIEGFMPDQVSQILSLPKSLVPTVLMTIGYANDKPRPKVRFPRDYMFIEKVQA